MAYETAGIPELDLRGGEAEIPRWPARELPLEPLASALAAGRACFGGSPVRALGPGSTRGIRRLTAKAGAIFGAFPEVAITGRGVAHAEKGGLAFVEAGIAGSSYLLGCGAIPGRPLVPGVPVEVVTGICLFGADSVLGWAGPEAYSMTVGQVRGPGPAHPIEEVTADPRWHVYEAETLGRLGSFIRDLASLGGQGPLRVTAHVPGPEYEIYGLSLYARGLLPRFWCDRYRDIARTRARMLALALQGCAGGAAEVTAASPLAFLGGLDTGAWPPGEVLSRLYEAVQAQDGLWDILLGGQPPSFSGLIYASYAHHYLTAAAAARERGHQMLLAEDPDEERIFRSAVAHGGLAAASLLVDVTGFYVHPQVVVTQTAFPGTPRILHKCRDGCDPRTVAAATRYYWPAGFRLPPGGTWPGHPRLAVAQLAAAAAGSRGPGSGLARLAQSPAGSANRVHSMSKSATPGARRLSHDQAA